MKRRSPITGVRRIGGALVALALAVSLSACQKADDPNTEATGTPSESTGAEATPQPSEDASSASGGDSEPESTQVFTDMGDDFRGVLADVTTEACPVDKGDVTAKGTVVNSADEAADLFIGVIWLKPDSGDSVAMGEWTAKDVAPGETVDWSVTATLKSKPGRCVLQAKANAAGTLK